MNRIVLLLLVNVATLVSCSKFLEEKSDKRLVTPNTLSDLQGMMDDHYFMNEFTPSLGEAYADDYFLTEENYNSQTEYTANIYKWEAVIENFSSEWARSYFKVYNANYCLENLEKLERTAANRAEWDNVKGSALFYRGFTFLQLTWQYGKAFNEMSSAEDPGIVLRLQSDFNVPSVRSSVQESYARVISDLKESLQYLPNLPVHAMRPSKAAAYAALARTYLSMRQYDSAYKYANASLQIKSDLLDYNSSEVSEASEVPFQPFNKEIVFYCTPMADIATWPGGNLVDTMLYESYDLNDLRKTVFFLPVNGYPQFKGCYTADAGLVFSGIATDEMFLVKAECEARLGQVVASMITLNTLLEKRWRTGSFVPFTAGDAGEALAIVLKERRKELVQRCVRFIDVKRLNMEGANIMLTRIIDGQVYTLPPNDSRYAVPLPLDIIRLTGIPQN